MFFPCKILLVDGCQLYKSHHNFALYFGKFVQGLGVLEFATSMCHDFDPWPESILYMTSVAHALKV